MRPILIILFSLVFHTGYGTDLQKKAEEIKAEAFKIYSSEKASWLGTDIMQEVYDSGVPSNLKGYFSYATEDAVRCVFYSNDSIPKILLTIEFDPSFNPEKTTVADYAREFSEREKEYYKLRKSVESVLVADTGYFNYYENTNYNVVPIIDEQSKRVYILTGTTSQGVVLFGNDYLLLFDDNYKLSSKERIHNTLISSPTHADTTGGTPVGFIHSHVPGRSEYMTATDIATALLYQGYTNWQSCTVISKDYFSIWSCSNNSLTIIPTKTLEKINKAEETRRKKEKQKD